MKKLLATTLFATVIAVGTSADAAFTLSGDLTFGSDYVDRGVKLAECTVHPSIEASVDDSYFGVWGALPLEKRNSKGYIDEWDFYAGYGYTLSDTVSLDLGATLYYYPIDQADDTGEAYAGINWDLERWTPGIYGYYDFDLDGGTWTLQGSIGYSIPMASAGTSADLSATGGYVSSSDGDSYSYYGVSAVVPYQISASASVSAGVHWASHNIDSLEDNHFYVTVSVSFSN
jgi:uncharacterized protein (TIGR02001 family)